MLPEVSSLQSSDNDFVGKSLPRVDIETKSGIDKYEWILRYGYETLLTQNWSRDLRDVDSIDFDRAVLGIEQVEQGQEDGAFATRLNMV